jgi:DNA-binding transcriptional ArsR family regulator
VPERISRGPAAASELAKPITMALPSFLQHLDVLESCGLVKSRKMERVRTYRLTPRPLRAAEGWFEKQRAIWNCRVDPLDT